MTKEIISYQTIKNETMDLDTLNSDAIDLMEGWDEKYNMDNRLSLDEYISQHCEILSKSEVKEGYSLMDKYDTI